MVPTIASGLSLLGTIGADTLIHNLAKQVAKGSTSVGTKILTRAGAVAISAVVGNGLMEMVKNGEERILQMQEKAIGLDVIGIVK